MDHNYNLPDGFSMQEVLRLAASPAGQQLIALMKQKDGPDMHKAMAQAAAGDYSQAKRAMESLLSDSTAKQLLKELRG